MTPDRDKPLVQTPNIPEATIVPTLFMNEDGQRLITWDGLDMVKHFEGCELIAKPDPVGVPTIGYGRIEYPGGLKVRNGDQCTQEQADRWLLEDLEKDGAHYVRAWIKPPLTDFQWSSLVSFVFNRGAGRFHEKIVGLLNTGDFSGAVACLLTYNFAGTPPRELSGLTRRRNAEKEMFFGGDWKKYKS